MKRLFVVVCLLALVPFTVGCRVGGLWGYDDDEGTAPVVTTAENVTLQADMTIPATEMDSTGSSLKMYEVELAIKIGGVTLTPASKETGTVNNVYKFSQKVARSGVTIDASGNSVFEIWAGSSKLFTGTLPVGVTGGTADNATNSYAITLTPDGKGGYTVTVTYIAPGAVTGTTVTQPAPVTSLLVESVGYAIGDVYYVLTNATNVPFSGTKVRVTFNTLVSDPISSFTVTFTSAGGTTSTFSAASIGDDFGATVATDTTSTNQRTIVDFELKGANLDRLKPATQYTVAFVNSTAVRADSATVSLTAPSSISFTTKKTSLQSWVARDAASASVGSSVTGKVTTATTKVELTFDHDVQIPDAASLATAEFAIDNVSATYGTYFDTPTQPSSKVLSVPFKSGYALTSGKSYTIIYKTGTFTDTTGNLIDTTSTISFTVE